MVMSWIYAALGNVGVVQALFFGLKAAVLAIVLDAVVRIGKRALKNNIMRALAAASFVAIFFFAVPFPVIILTAGLIGLFGGHFGIAAFLGGGGHGKVSDRQVADADSALGEETPAHAHLAAGWSVKIAALFLVLWLGPVLVLLATLGGANVFSQIAVFFSKMAVVTFGGAYAVLAYVAQEAVETYGWLKPSEMLDGLGMAETTPGPADHGVAVRRLHGRLPGSRRPASDDCRHARWHACHLGHVHAVFSLDIPRLRENPKTPLAKRRDPDSTERMIRPGFLDIESRQNLIELARDGLAAHRLARRANALVLLDDGMSCEAIAKVLLLDDDTIRTWYRLYEGDGIEGLTNFSYEGSACQLSGEQQEKLKAWVATALPRTTRQVGAWIENEFGVVYEGRSGLIALLHRLGLEYHKPNVIPRKLDEEKQRAFIEGYEKLLNSLGDDEAVLFADAVHPTHAARPVGCWAPSQEKLAIEQTSGRQRINIHGAIDLETGQTRMIEALTIDAASTIRLLQSIEALYPMLALIHVFLDNARYHHAKLVQEWLALPGRRIKLHFIPTYCPHLNPIERLWGLMHRNVTHNKCYATCAQFADATLSFLREKVPGNWADLCDSVTDNFRIINPKDFRVMT